MTDETQNLEGRCVTCRWWGDDEDAAIGNHRRECNHPKLDATGGRDFAPDGAGVFDQRITTGPIFGCVNWQTADPSTEANGE